MLPGNLIKDYLTFNQKEQRGVIVLVCIFFFFLSATMFLPVILPVKKFDFTVFEGDVLLFEKEMAKLDSLQKHKGRYSNNNFNSKGFYGNQDTGSRLRFPTAGQIIIDLNSADTFELQQLRGIGSSFARRIVKYRERLGGFVKKSQLLEVWGMDTSRYNRISSNLIINPDSVHRIDLNTVTFKELLFHPYFPFELTKAIMIYRKEHKKIHRVDELKSVPGIHDSAYRKIADYLRVAD